MIATITVYLYAGLCMAEVSRKGGNLSKAMYLIYLFLWPIFIPVGLIIAKSERAKQRRAKEEFDELRRILSARPGCKLQHGSGSSWCDLCGGKWDYGDYDGCKPTTKEK